MTDEQNKPVRSREAQKWDGYPENPKMDGFHWLEHNGGEKLIPFEWDAHDELWMFDDDSICFPDTAGKRFRYHGPCLPPKARGAAEQRRKDGDEQEAVYQVYRGDYYGWFDCKKSEWEEDEREPEHKRILYAHPANVAALEARVKELDSQNGDLLRELNTTYLERDRYRKCMSDCVDLLEKAKPGTLVRVWLKDCLETARTALKREGGE